MSTQDATRENIDGTIVYNESTWFTATELAAMPPQAMHSQALDNACRMLDRAAQDGSFLDMGEIYYVVTVIAGRPA